MERELDSIFAEARGRRRREREREREGRHMRVTVTPKDEERLVVLMARERPRSAVVAPGGDLVTAGGGGGGGGGGEGSDGDSSGSLEEISADDFKKESSAAGGAAAAAAAAAAQQRSRVWMGYNIPRSYAPAFHSFAWAQAVQNKPLVPRAADAADEDEVEHVVDTSDEEKEEGEIEEGEAVQTTTTSSSSPPCAQPPETIDLDSDAPEKSESMVAMDGGGAAPAGAEEEEVDFDQRVGSILEELEMVSIEEAEKYGLMILLYGKVHVLDVFWCMIQLLRDPILMFCRSFEGACTRLRTCFENLKPLFPESGSPMPMLDALVQQAFVGIDTITTVRPTVDLALCCGL